MRQTTIPSDCGKRLLPSTIDNLAKSEPTRAFFYVPKTTNLSDGYDEITVKLFSDAVHRAAWWLQDTLGVAPAGFPTLGYIGPNDLRYFVLMVACIKTGYKLLFCSPRNSIEGQISLCEKTNCQTWLRPKGVDVDEILARRSMKEIPVPDLNNFINTQPAKPYPYTKTLKEARRDEIIALHTSGSTGLPKPVIHTNGTPVAFDRCQILPPLNGKENQSKYFRGRTILSFLPPFHGAGLNFGLWGAVFLDAIIVFPPVGPPSAAVVEKILKCPPPGGIDALFLAPSTIEEITKNPHILKLFSTLEFVMYGGGPLSLGSGDIVNKTTPLMNALGMTEASWIIASGLDRQDWAYFNFHPGSCVQMRPRSDGLFESVFVRSKEVDEDGERPIESAVFETFPDLEEWVSGDIYSEHPTRPDYWLYEGRGDDIIVLSNGEKLNPLSMEGSIGRHQFVRSALVVGQARFQTGVILELSPEASGSEEEIIDAIWPLIEKSNDEAPQHARLTRDHVMVGRSDKLFPRAGKGSVQRRAALKLYEEEISHMYDSAEERALQNVPEIDTVSKESIKGRVRDAIVNITQNSEISDDADFFSVGVDSLQILQLQRQLRGGLRNHQTIQIDQRLLYSHPTIDGVTEAVWAQIHNNNSNGHRRTSNIEQMNEMIEKYSTKTSSAKGNRPVPEVGSYKVILTGSTGSLGSYILDVLMNSKSVEKIWCLNRGETSQERQSESSQSRGLENDWSKKSVDFFHADLSKSNFGLEQAQFEDLMKNATHIIHNQWRVDFNLSLSSFEPQVAGVKQLIELCAMSKNLVTLFFISSIGVVSNYPNPSNSNQVPELPIEDLSFAGMGYGEAKLVSECLIRKAVKSNLLHGATCRVAQIAGPVKRGNKGQWNRKEWFPTIIDTSATLNLLPTDMGVMTVIDWTPVDYLAEMITELTFSSAISSGQAAPPPKLTTASGIGNRIALMSNLEPELAVFHARNPKSAGWGEVVGGVKDHIEKKTKNKVNLVSWSVWVASLREVARKGTVGVEGVKLLDFYEGVDVKDEKASQNGHANGHVNGGNGDVEQTETRGQGLLDVSKTIEESGTMAELTAPGSEWMTIWLEQWGY